MAQDYPGHVHLATDAWTSPNHRAFVAWTVHLEHDGHMLSFLLDIVELPEVCPLLHDHTHNPTPWKSHTGLTMARAFQQMLKKFNLTKKVLAITADNATSNDKQTTALANMSNSFEEVN